MFDRLQALRNSVQHLRAIASEIDRADYTSSAYPSEWTIADTFSHLGSGAVIGKRSFEDSVAHRDSDADFNQSVWAEWNAKGPSDQVSDCLVSDAAYLSCLEETTEDQRAAFQMKMGPFAFNFDGLVGLRLGEHVLHTWDVEVPFHPDAKLPNDAANAILDGIQFIASRTAKPPGNARDITIRTSNPVRDFTLILGVDSAELIEKSHEGAAELEIPAESLVRLIYGRLDEEHTPESVRGDVVDFLRSVYPGF
jgi:uncharacterized protein (TIGR03083 family)